MHCFQPVFVKSSSASADSSWASLSLSSSNIFSQNNNLEETPWLRSPFLSYWIYVFILWGASSLINCALICRFGLLSSQKTNKIWIDSCISVAVNSVVHSALIWYFGLSQDFKISSVIDVAIIDVAIILAVNIVIYSAVMWYFKSSSQKKDQKIVQRQSSVRVTRASMADFLKYSTNELQCSICNELFIQPRIINCGHIMCLFCLTEWKKEQKNCPLCRCLITSHCKCPTIDNIIDGIVRSFPDTLKKERSNVISSRDNNVPATSDSETSQNLDDQNRLHSNLSDRRPTARYFYTSFFNRPEYLNDFEVHA